MKRPCLVCNEPTEGPRCERHRTYRYEPRTTTERGLGAEHRRIRAQVLAEESRCWLCGGLPTHTDPLEADHIIPRSKGGLTVRSNYRAAHASCNRSRGNRSIA